MSRRASVAKPSGSVRGIPARLRISEEPELVEPESTEVHPPAFGPPFASYQAEIFLRGMSGETPP